jgi:hypothetical protein
MTTGVLVPHRGLIDVGIGKGVLSGGIETLHDRSGALFGSQIYSSNACDGDVGEAVRC